MRSMKPLGIVLSAFLVLLAAPARAAGIQPPEYLHSTAEVDAAATATRTEAENCRLLAEGMQMALDNPDAILLLNNNAVQVIMPRHVDELIARLRLLYIADPDAVSQHKAGLATALGIPEWTLDGILDADSLMSDMAGSAVMGLLREHFASDIAAARTKMENTIRACATIQQMAELYLQGLEERRKELLGAGAETVAYSGNDLLINGLPLDVCMHAGNEPYDGEVYPCEGYAANRFCQSKGHAAQISFLWTYLARSSYPDGSVCDKGEEFGCAAFTEIVCGSPPG